MSSINNKSYLLVYFDCKTKGYPYVFFIVSHTFYRLYLFDIFIQTKWQYVQRNMCCHWHFIQCINKKKLFSTIKYLSISSYIVLVTRLVYSICTLLAVDSFILLFIFVMNVYIFNYLCKIYTKMNCCRLIVNHYQIKQFSFPDFNNSSSDRIFPWNCF